MDEGAQTLGPRPLGPGCFRVITCYWAVLGGCSARIYCVNYWIVLCPAPCFIPSE